MWVTRCSSLATLHAWFRLKTFAVQQQQHGLSVGLFYYFFVFLEGGWKKENHVSAHVCGCARLTGWDLSVSETTSEDEKRFLGNQLCKYKIMQMGHLNKSVYLGRKRFSVLFHTWTPEQKEGGGKIRISLVNVTGRHSVELKSWFSFLIRRKEVRRKRERSKRRQRGENNIGLTDSIPHVAARQEWIRWEHSSCVTVINTTGTAECPPPSFPKAPVWSILLFAINSTLNWSPNSVVKGTPHCQWELLRLINSETKRRSGNAVMRMCGVKLLNSTHYRWETLPIMTRPFTAKK